MKVFLTHSIELSKKSTSSSVRNMPLLLQMNPTQTPHWWLSWAESGMEWWKSQRPVRAKDLFTSFFPSFFCLCHQERALSSQLSLLLYREQPMKREKLSLFLQLSGEHKEHLLYTEGNFTFPFLFSINYFLAQRKNSLRASVLSYLCETTRNILAWVTLLFHIILVFPRLFTSVKLWTSGYVLDLCLCQHSIGLGAILIISLCI